MSSRFRSIIENVQRDKTNSIFSPGPNHHEFKCDDTVHSRPLPSSRFLSYQKCDCTSQRNNSYNNIYIQSYHSIRQRTVQHSSNSTHHTSHHNLQPSSRSCHCIYFLLSLQSWKLLSFCLRYFDTINFFDETTQRMVGK